MGAIHTAKDFQRETGVDDVVLGHLQTYVALLEKWQAKINLVGPKTLPDVWSRHIMDSAQVWPLLPDGTTRLVDFGSGAGFPGLVLAIMGVPQVTLVESDQRKGAFLGEVIRATGCGATVLSERIEALEPWDADVVTARALAPLSKLLEYSVPFLQRGAKGIFLKGKNIEEEFADAKKLWHIIYTLNKSRVDDESWVVEIEEVHRV